MKPSTAEILIRPMTPADVNWAKELSDALPEAPHWPIEAYVAAVGTKAEPRRIALVAEYAARLDTLDFTSPGVGFAVARVIPPQAELETIVVSSLARRAGVGRAMMAALKAGLQSDNVTEVTLEVRASNQPALALYSLSGFKESGRRPRYYADPVEDAVLMKLKLR